MQYTQVFATSQERDELQANLKAAKRTPAIMLNIGGGCAAHAQRRVQERCHALALNYGLPEFVGFYGMTADGEFVRP